MLLHYALTYRIIQFFCPFCPKITNCRHKPLNMQTEKPGHGHTFPWNFRIMRLKKNTGPCLN